MIFLFLLSIFLPAVLTNSETEKWSWPSTHRDQTSADSRKDIYYENVNSNEKAGRIRVPSSYYDNGRPQQAYHVQDPVTSRPRPLSDEFSNEEESSNDNVAYNSNRFPQANTANRFGPQQPNDFPGQFGQGGFPGAGGFAGGPAQFPGAFGGQRYPGQFLGGQYPIGGGGYPQHNNIANGILVGPGGPTGILGRPPFGGGGYGGGYGNGYPGAGGFGGYPGAFNGYQGGYPGAGGLYGGQQGFYGGQQGLYGGPQGLFGGQHGLYGGQNGLYGGQHGGLYGGLNGPYGGNPYNQFGNGYAGGFGNYGGGHPNQLFSPAIKNLQRQKVEKSEE